MDRRLEAYSCGNLTGYQVVELFSDLIQGGAAWGTSSGYGKTAAEMIREGVISPSGQILMSEEEIETYFNF